MNEDVQKYAFNLQPFVFPTSALWTYILYSTKVDAALDHVGLERLNDFEQISVLNCCIVISTMFEDNVSPLSRFTILLTASFPSSNLPIYVKDIHRFTWLELIINERIDVKIDKILWCQYSMGYDITKL